MTAYNKGITVKRNELGLEHIKSIEEKYRKYLED